LGKRLFSRGEFDKCTDVLTAGLAVSPSRPDEWFLLGMIAMNANKWAPAMKAFTRTLQYDNERSDAWANIGTMFLHMNQYEKAVNALTQVCGPM
jgi:cytochrome c-type biogenesis protein CcmH/NrfG